MTKGDRLWLGSESVTVVRVEERMALVERRSGEQAWARLEELTPARGAKPDRAIKWVPRS